jgi:hypothetical protein
LPDRDEQTSSRMSHATAIHLSSLDPGSFNIRDCKGVAQRSRNPVLGQFEYPHFRFPHRTCGINGSHESNAQANPRRWDLVCTGSSQLRFYSPPASPPRKIAWPWQSLSLSDETVLMAKNCIPTDFIVCRSRERPGRLLSIGWTFRSECLN